LKYQSYSGGSSKNLFQLFIEKVISLNPKLFSFIVPESLLTTESNGKLREILVKNYNLNSIVVFDHFVFQDATIGTTIFVADKNAKSKTKIIKIDNQRQIEIKQEVQLPKNSTPWDISLDKSSKVLFEKILLKSKLLGEISEMSKGMVVKDRAEVLLEKPTKKSLPFLLGNCMSKYYYQLDKYAEYDSLEIIGGTRDFTKQTSTPRLFIRRTGSSLCATYSDKAELIESTIYILRSQNFDLKYILGLINSKLLTFYLTKKLITNSQGFPQVLMGQLEQLPIYNIISKDEIKIQKEIVVCVENLLNLNKEIREVKLQTKIDQIKQRIEHAEDKINQLVYELYELTPEEIEIIEESTSK